MIRNSIRFTSISAGWEGGREAMIKPLGIVYAAAASISDAILHPVCKTCFCFLDLEARPETPFCCGSRYGTICTAATRRKL
jgi:hypothetical protein